jgi:ribosomal protein S18 acetylase RimI-like enzyme
MFELKIVGREFADQLARLQTETFQQAYGNVHSLEDISAYCLTNYTLQAARCELSSELTVCCVGSVELEPSGYYIVKHQDSPIPFDSKSSELKQIYILASTYGLGLGQALYEHALETVRSANSQWLWLCVSDINYRAQAFYKKLGFRKLGTGPILKVGKDQLSSSILAIKL